MDNHSNTKGAFHIAVGLFRAVRRSSNPLTSGELAAMVEVDELYVLKWLSSMMARDYVKYDPETERYYMKPRQLYHTAGGRSSLSIAA